MEWFIVLRAFGEQERLHDNNHRNYYKEHNEEVSLFFNSGFELIGLLFEACYKEALIISGDGFTMVMLATASSLENRIAFCIRWIIARMSAQDTVALRVVIHKECFLILELLIGSRDIS